ncbi:MAG: hypothetical protein CL827_02625 [Crocinitomicaceae bacterium]|nr:hypothetical protein [Crocinitomicaceae bacterium]|tara:strand:+ start:12618 stop:13688 length:1071 start_codon:yes stop_codon:yes gene_type:complete
MTKKMYFNKLDSLRTFAFLLVYWQHIVSIFLHKIHINSTLLNKIIIKFIFTGGVGVHIFFVLSGFLITYLLIQETKKNKKINIKFFYFRRALRIWPVYYLVLITGIFIIPNIFKSINFEGNILMNLLFFNNYYLTGSPISITWSVAIEEQFYIFWPILFALFKGKRILYLSYGIFLFSLFYSLHYSGTKLGYYGTISNLKYLMVGCIGSILFSKKNKSLIKLLNHKNFKLEYIVITTIILHVSSNIFYSLAAVLNVILIVLYLLIILNLVLNSNNNSTVFTKIGKYTYGLYLYHPTVILICKIFFDKYNLNYKNEIIPIVLLITTSTILTFGVAKISYNYFEKYFLKIKRKYNLLK